MSAEKGKPVRPRKWRRRLLRIALWGAGALVLLRVALGIGMPWILDRVAASRGLTCSYDSMNLSLLAGHLELWQLELRPLADGDEPPGDPVVRLEYATADLDVTALLTGGLVVRRAEIDGLTAYLQREADGSLHLSGVTVTEPAPVPEAEAEPTANDAEPRRALDLTPPLVVHAARAQRVALHVRDVAEGRTRTWHLDTALSHLGSEERDAELAIDLWSPGAIEALRVRGRGRGGIASLDADLEVIGRGLRPHAVESLLAALDLGPAADRVDFGLRVRARMEPDGSEDPAGRLTVEVRRMHWLADGSESLGLDLLKLQVPALDRTAAENTELTLRGLRGVLARTAQGRTRWGGLELLPRAETPRAAAAVAASGTEGPPFRLHVRECAIRDVAFTLQDQAVHPASDLRVELPLVSVRDAAPVPRSLTARLRVPGAVEELNLEVDLEATEDRREVALRAQGSGVTLDTLEPWLRAAGLEPTLRDAELAFAVSGDIGPGDDGGIAANLVLSDLVLRDPDELLRLDSVSVEGLHSTPDRLHVAGITVLGPTLPIRHEPDGALAFAGLRTVEPTPAPVSEPVEASVPESPDVAAGSVVVDRLTWRGLDIRWTDEQWVPPMQLALQDAEVTVTGIALGAGGEREPARLQATLAVPGIVRDFQLSGELQHHAAEQSLVAELSVRGEGLSLLPLAPYLESLGIEPLLDDGELQLRVESRLQQGPDGPRVSLSAHDASLREGDREWLALDRADIRGARSEARGTDVDSVTLRGLRVIAKRDAVEGVAMLGVALRPSPATEPQAAEVKTAAAAAAELPPPPPLRLRELSVEDLEVHWSDTALPEPLEVTARAQLSVRGIDTGSPETPADWQARLQVPGELEELTIGGSLTLAEAGPSLTAALRARGLGPNVLAAYLPEGIVPALDDGRLRAEITASQSVESNGEQHTRITVSDFDYRDAQDEEPLLAATSLVASVRSSEQELVLEELTSAGVATAVSDTAEGLEILGLRISPSPTEPEDVPEGGAEPDTTRKPTQALPWQIIRVEKFDVGVERLLWRNRGNGGRDTVANLRIATPGPQVLLEEDVEELEPMAVEVTGSIEGVLEELRAGFHVRPFTADPELDLAFRARGLDGRGLMEVFPALAEKLDAGGLESGSLGGDLHVRLRMPRRSPTELDFSRPFGGTLELTDLEYRAVEDGPVLAGVEAATAEITRLQPGSGQLHVAFLEVYEPTLTARQHKDGLHALGVLWKNAPPAETESETEPASGEAAAATRDPGPRVRVDLVSLQGLDLDYVDESVEPAVPVPLRNLDVEVRGYRNDPNRGPVRFRANVSSGNVPLPERDYSSLVGGILSAAAGVVTGGKGEREIEQRPFFDEIALSGSLQLDPILGWVEVGVRSLELLNMRGLAVQSGVDIGDGLLDAAVRLDFQDGGDLAVDSNLVFQYLSLSEPAGGPVSTYLKLPAPLDTVLFVLRDSSGEHVIPLSFTVEQGRLSGGQIASAAVSAFGQLVATAIAKSPLRVAGTVTDLFGLTGGEPEAVEYDPIAVVFPAGSAALGPSQRQALEPLVELLLDDEELAVAVQHRLGTADAEQAEALANPEPEQTRELGQRLRQRKAELVLQRERSLVEARALWAAGDSVGGAEVSERLRALDRELGRTEQALDEVYGLLRPGADRRRESRAREAARTIARMRMLAVRDYLAQRGVTDVEARFETRRPRSQAEEGRERSEIVLQPRVRLVR